MKTLLFIKKHGIQYESVIPPELCSKIISDPSLSKTVWEYFKDVIPKKCEGGNLVGYGNIELIKYENVPVRPKKRREAYIYDDNGNVTAATIFLYLNTIDKEGNMVFFSNPISNLKFSANSFISKPIAGNAVLFTNFVCYQEQSVFTQCKYVLKIPILYTSSSTSSSTNLSTPSLTSKKKKRVTFSDKYQIKYINKR